MFEQTLDIATKDGAMETFIVHPDHGVHPPVLMLMDAPGIREELLRYGPPPRHRRLLCPAAEPVLSCRPRHDIRSRRPTKGSAEQARMRAVRTKMTIPPVMDDVADDARVRRHPTGRKARPCRHAWLLHERPVSLAAAARYPDRIAAAASFYGTWLVSENEESPHLNLGKAKGELYIACAEHDELAPLPMVDELKALFDKSGNRGELEMYPAVHHGFAFPQRWCYDKPAAERHWERLIALYRRQLG